MVDQSEHVGKKYVEITEKVLPLLLVHDFFRQTYHMVQKFHNLFSVIVVGLVPKRDISFVYQIIVIVLKVINLVLVDYLL